MNGRQRVVAAIAGEQPRRRWELVEQSHHRDVYRDDRGYRLEVWITAAGSVRCANLRSPAGAHRYVLVQSTGKAEQIAAWVASPASYFGPGEVAP